VITLEGLTKRYGGTTAVDSLDLTVHPGRVTGFLGPNGAGKSTTKEACLDLTATSVEYGVTAEVDGEGQVDVERGAAVAS
jgi:ABC-2 type transport system ATP-binding protein